MKTTFYYHPNGPLNIPSKAETPPPTPSVRAEDTWPQGQARGGAASPQSRVRDESEMITIQLVFAREQHPVGNDSHIRVTNPQVTGVNRARRFPAAALPTPTPPTSPGAPIEPQTRTAAPHTIS